MMQPYLLSKALLGVFLFFLTLPAHAWNSTGHKVIATIAYRQLDRSVRGRLAELLREHPAFPDWTLRSKNGLDADLNMLWHASVFPDNARKDPYRSYNRPMAHYVNFRILGDLGNRVDEPLPGGENILNAYSARLKQVRDPKTLPRVRALAISWIAHLAGDVHQPLHNVSRFSSAFPNGDRGGNGVSVPNPHGDAAATWDDNLHAYWDDLLGNDDSAMNLNSLAESIMAEHPRTRFGDELTRRKIGDWSRESLPIALRTVYYRLDPAQTRFDELPIGYHADARKVARRRIALAGYRLAEELRGLL